ncbi:ricin B lectin domain-containing protein [Coprinopsis sp. MPI-PUGE-AT-0042]|nr:ricin B lectin domain-containing protein [Coprinopsis sp. MPI-PUGE-AT-0042]
MQRVISSALVLLAVGVGSNAQTFTSIPLPGLEIYPNGQPGKCVEVRGGVFANGTPVQMQVLSQILVARREYSFNHRTSYDCNGSAAQKWVFTRNQVQAQIRLANTNFCLDAGDNPFQPNGNTMKIWECYPTLPQQRWYIGDDSTIKFSDVRYGVCLDLTDGRLDNTNVLQTWECSANNNNQLWQGGPPTSTVVAIPTPITDFFPTETDATLTRAP